jgi:F-type H+-transporting ATPase subunit a
MDVHVEIAAETLFEIGPLAVTNSMVTMFAVMGLILLGGWLLARNLKDVPGRGQSMAETVVEFLLGLVEGSAGKTAGRRIFPLVGGIFIFVALANYSGMLPGVGTVGYYHVEEDMGAEDGEGNVDDSDEQTTVEEATESDGHEATEGESHEATEETSLVGETASTGVTDTTTTPPVAQEGDRDESTGGHDDEGAHKVLVPFLRAPNADLNMTLGMALVTFTTVQILGIRAHGVGGRIKHMANPPFLFPIELISELSRIISLSARLFGNVFAGEVLLGVMYAMAAAIKIALIPLLFPVVFLFLELLFGTIQALVFALLTLIYITLATEGGHGDHVHGEGGEFGVADDPGHGLARATAGHAD